MLRILFFTVLLTSLLLMAAGCASSGHPVDVRNAEITTRAIENGDKVEEFRVGGQLRMVRVTPVRGPVYYLYDRDGDGRMDSDKDGVSPVYWQIYSW
ncbi:MAG: DUF2782 domain-containing protein [Xanthomonadaceae bacterium]|jgi:hypothetical protein|nr:DUF2782 domain-containing protein [Xanthomonadaceae bacterium]